MNVTAFVLALVITLGYYAYSVRKQRSILRAQADCSAEPDDRAERRG